MISGWQNVKKSNLWLRKGIKTDKKDDAVIDKTTGIPDARIKIDHIHW